MPRKPSARRLRRGAALVLLLLSGAVLLSLRRVDGSKGTAVVIEGRLPARPPRIAAPGWYLAFPGLRRITRYSTEPQTLSFSWPPPGGPPLRTAEGSRVVVRGSIEYRVPDAAVLALHRRARGETGARVLLPELERIGREEIQSLSFSRISGAHRLELEARLAARFGPWSRSAGLVLRDVRVDSVRLEGGSLPPRPPLEDTRVLLIGLDGADWDVLDPLMAAGRLPTLARLVRSGVRARLESIEPPISPVVWTTAATGFLPSRHGILDFVVTDRRTGKTAPVTSRQRRVRAIWGVLGEAGIPVGVIGWWATWPAEFVEGYVVTDRVAYQLPGQAPPTGAEGKTFPPDLFNRILPLIVSPGQIPDSRVGRFVGPAGRGGARNSSDSDRVEQFRTVLASTETYEAIARALAGRGFQPFQALYFEGIDTTSHLFMPFRPPRRPGVDPRQFERFHRAVEEFYVYQDEVLGRLLERVSEPTNVLVISDHGFKSAADRPSRESRVEFGTAALWHRRHGVLIASGPAVRRAVRIPDASVVDITPTILALFGLPVGEDMAGRPIRDLFTDQFLAAHPVTYRPSWESGATPAGGPAASDPEGDRALREKLISLGYLGQTGSLPRNNLGNSLLAEGKVDQAVAEFRAAIAEAPGMPILHLNLARAFLVRGDFAGARVAVERALALEPGSPEGQVLRADLDLREGRVKEAESRLRRVLREEPSAPGAHRSLGILYQNQGDPTRAEQEYLMALDLDPDDAESYNNLGVLRRAAGRLEEAGALFGKALAANPEFFGAYNNLALVAMDREDWEEADRLLGEGLKRTGDNPILLNNRGNLRFTQGRLDEAADCYRRAAGQDPAYAEPRNGMGMVRLARGDLAGAEADFDAALKLKPGYPDALLNRGRLRADQGNEAGAEKDFRSLLSARPGEPAASRELARLLIRRGEVPEAERILRAALEKHDSDAELWTMLGRCLTLEGRDEEAARMFRRAQEGFSGPPEGRGLHEPTMEDRP